MRRVEPWETAGAKRAVSMQITKYALKFNTTVAVLILFIILAGGFAYKTLPLEAQPEVEIPTMLVSTIYPGVAPEDMEKLVTNVLESELKDLRDVKKITSSSSESSSVVTVEFEAGVDLDIAYQKLRDKVEKAKPDLPADAEDPVIIEINLSDFPMMLINVSGRYDLDKLKNVSEKIKDDIEQIPGVLGVDLTGGLEREIQIYLDPKKLQHYELGVSQIIGRIQGEHRTTPAGNLELGSSKYSVRIPGEYKDVSLMEDIVVKAEGGVPIRLGDVGRVLDGFKEQETISRINGTECVTLRVKKRAGASIVDIADEVRAVLAEKEATLPPTTAYTIRQDSSEFIRDTVSDLENNIITGLILVIGVLLFAMGVRNAIFVAIAIPLSMLMSFVILQTLGITLNMVVLFALILALGMLVDNSIVVVENIYRHVAEGQTRLRAAYEATREVAWPIVTSTATTICVFAPLLFWPGIMGDFMKYLPITVITVLSSSLFVALVINPVIAARFLKSDTAKMFDDSGEVRGRILPRYKALLVWSLNHPKTVFLAGIVVLVATIGAYVKFGAGVEFFPTTTPERAQVIVTAPQGTLLERTDGYMKRVEGLAQKQGNVQDVVANVGFGGGMMLGAGSNSSHLAVADIEFKDRRERSGSTWEDIESLREGLGKLAGAEYRVEIEKNGPPTGSPVSVEVSGPEYGVLSAYARKIKDLLSTVDGVVDIKDDYEAGKPEIRIEVDRQKAMLRKVDTATISQAVRTAINGTIATVLREGDEEYDIIVRYEEDDRRSIEDILNIRVAGRDDVQIPLRDVAKVTTVGGMGSINHIEQRRTIAVTADVMGERSSSEIMQEVEQRVTSELSLPAGYFFSFTGESEEQENAQAFLGKAFAVGIMLMALILITQFNSVQRPILILGSVVMSLVGVFLGLLILHNKFSIIMTGMGVISLAGVVVNNAIVLIDYADQLKEKLGLTLKEALVRAGLVRFRPVMLTAITTVLGLLPMAVGIGIDFKHITTNFIDIGSQSVEWWGPMAQAVVFGLIVATALTLIMVPVMYELQERSSAFFARLLGRKDTTVPPAAVEEA